LSGPGALVVHGLTGSPQSVAGLGAALEGAGFIVGVPLLPGHGTSPEDLARCGWAEWEGAVEDAYARLPPPVVVAGLSMGGALAAGVAARHPEEVAGLIAINPFVDPPVASFQALLGDLLAAGEPFLPGIGDDTMAADAPEEEAYDRLPVAALLSMCQGLDALRPSSPASAARCCFSPAATTTSSPWSRATSWPRRSPARSSGCGWSAAPTWPPSTSSATSWSGGPSPSPSG
jgi:pimeloyl-ACP methyl ester carboxylesterase